MNKKFRHEFEREVFLQLEEIFPNARIEINKTFTLEKFKMEVDLIIHHGNKSYAIECKSSNKNQIVGLSNIMCKLRQLKKSKLFDQVILITANDFPKIKKMRFEKSGIKVLTYLEINEIGIEIKRISYSNLIKQVLGKHNLSVRQLALLLDMKSKKGIYEYENNGIPKSKIKKLEKLLERSDSRKVHFEAFKRSINSKKLYYRFFRESLNLTQEKFSQKLGIKGWSYAAFEAGLEDQKYIYGIIDKKINKICFDLNMNSKKLDRLTIERVKETLKIVRIGDNISPIVGFNFPSTLKLGTIFENSINLNSIYKNSFVLRNVIIADHNVINKYEVDALIIKDDSLILIEFKKRLTNSGRKITNFISDLLERQDILKPNKTLIISSSEPTETDLNRFSKANIEYIKIGLVV
ncbi:hypothetical protein J4471_03410 [Candidatus Woesearchaeota archaeon]|nr:hypothetical protein [Candidatus Woesearchaeota archaeon]